MSKIRKFTDWSSWWDGLRTNLFKCIGTTGTSWLGSDAIANIGIPQLSNLGLNWKQAVGLFAVHIGFEVFTYMKNVQPAVITETVDTTFHVQKPDGTTVAQSSTTTTTTPAEPAKPPTP